MSVVWNLELLSQRGFKLAPKRLNENPSGRSLSHLLSIIEDLKQKGVDFVSVQDGFDTSTASGKMVMLLTN